MRPPTDWNMTTFPVRLAALAAAIGAYSACLPSSAGDDCVPGWVPFVGGTGPDSGVAAGLALHDDGNGPSVFIGGSFTTIGGVAAPRIVKAVISDTGIDYIPLGTGFSSAECYSLASFQGGLFAAGYFDLAGDVAGTAKLARWDGTAWNSVGAQLEGGLNQLWGLTAWNSAQGNNLYISGNFTNIGGSGANFFARFDGTSFHPVGTAPIAGNVPLIVFSSHVHDDGSGPAIYIGGRFTSVDGVPANRIARWNGTAWSAVGTGMLGSGSTPSVNTMVTFDDGTGDALYAFGTFTASGTTPINRMAKWNGTSWEQRGGGASGTVFNALPIAGKAGEGDALLVSGQFTSIGADTRIRVALHEGCPDDATTPGDLNGDGSVNGFDFSVLLGFWG